MASTFHCIHGASCRSERAFTGRFEAELHMFLCLNPLLPSNVSTKDCLVERQNVEMTGRAKADATQVTLASIQAIDKLD